MHPTLKNQLDPISLYKKGHLGNKFGVEEHLLIHDLIENNYNSNVINLLIKKEYQAEEMYLILDAFNRGKDISYFRQNNLNTNQIRTIYQGLIKNLDVSLYASNKFNYYQMREILTGLKIHIDVSRYAKPEYPSMKMKYIRLKMTQHWRKKRA